MEREQLACDSCGESEPVPLDLLLPRPPEDLPTVPLGTIPLTPYRRKSLHVPVRKGGAEPYPKPGGRDG